MRNPSPFFLDFGLTRFYFNAGMVGEIHVGRIGRLGLPESAVTLENLRLLLVFDRVLKAQGPGAKFTEVPLAGKGGKLNVPVADVLAFVAQLRVSYPRHLRPEVPEFYRLTHELRWLVPSGPTWQPLKSLQQKWEHCFGFEPDVWLSAPVVPDDAREEPDRG